MCLYENTPATIKSLFDFRNVNRQLPLRNTGLDLTVPRAKSEFRKKCFDCVGVTLWNDLPPNIRIMSNITIFKKDIKRHILKSRM
jgi:hypothetical protein